MKAIWSLIFLFCFSTGFAQKRQPAFNPHSADQAYYDAYNQATNKLYKVTKVATKVTGPLIKVIGRATPQGRSVYAGYKVVNKVIQVRGSRNNLVDGDMPSDEISAGGGYALQTGLSIYDEPVQGMRQSIYDAPTEVPISKGYALQTGKSIYDTPVQGATSGGWNFSSSQPSSAPVAGRGWSLQSLSTQAAPTAPAAPAGGIYSLR